MSNNIVLTYALNFAALIALICAVYVLKMHFNKQKALKLNQAKELENEIEEQ